MIGHLRKDFLLLVVVILIDGVFSFERLDKRSDGNSDESLNESLKALDNLENGGIGDQKVPVKRFEPFSHGDRYFGEKRRDALMIAKRFELLNDVDKKFDPYTKRFDPYSKRFDPYSKRFDPYSKRFDPYIKRFNPYSKRFDPFTKRFNPYYKRFNPYFKRFDPFTKRFNPYAKRFDPYISFDSPEPSTPRVRRLWLDLDQNKRSIIDPQAFQISLGK